MLFSDLYKYQYINSIRQPKFKQELWYKLCILLFFCFIGYTLTQMGVNMGKALDTLKFYPRSIDTFNFLFIFILWFDFLIKYLFKSTSSIQILPYLNLPIPKRRLFNFIIMKELYSPWNLYILFLLIPFSITSVIPYYGIAGAISYVLFIYLLYIANSYIAFIANIFFKSNLWYYLIPIILILSMANAVLLLHINIGKYTVMICEQIMSNVIIAYLLLFTLIILFWKLMQHIMGKEIYNVFQDTKAFYKENNSYLNSSIARNISQFIYLEITMIKRSKRLKPFLYINIIFLFFYFYTVAKNEFYTDYSLSLFFTMFTMGNLGVNMLQYIFSMESSYFDGLMSWHISVLQIMRSKYILYVFFAFVMLLIMSIPAYFDRQEFIYLISIFFYLIGFVYFLLFQNAVYNKSYMNLSQNIIFNAEGSSANMMIISMIAMFAPLILVILVDINFGSTVAHYFMLITGICFTATSTFWLKWTYQRFLKNKYKNISGFRANQ